MSNSKQLLTIAIPTYNRIPQLKNTLTKLLPQLNDDCFLLIIDNCSDIPVDEYAKELFEQYPNVAYEIRRNRVNIGGDSNIIRCFEYCETQWLWTLGDDDELQPNAVEIIFSDINKNPNLVFINYNSPAGNRPNRTKATHSYGREEFLKNIDSFGATIFISCNIYNTEYLRPFHWLANNNTYSCVSQWLILFYALKNGGETILSDKIICINPIVTTGGEILSINVAFGVATLLDMPVKQHEKKLIIACLKKDMHNLVSVQSAFRTLIMQYMATKDESYLFLFRRLYFVYYRYFGLTIYLKYVILNMFFTIAPNLIFKLICMLYKKKRGIDLNTLLKNNLL